MSHVVTVKLSLKDEEALKSAVGLMEGASFKVGDNYEKSFGKHKMYGGQTCEGVAVVLPGWSHPVVISTATGEVKYDNFNGSWGDQTHIDQLVQIYGVEAAKIQAMIHGQTFVEDVLDNGDIKLTVSDYSSVG